jgi:hypothetical protein
MYYLSILVLIFLVADGISSQLLIHTNKQDSGISLLMLFLGIDLFGDGGKNRENCSVWLWQVTHAHQAFVAAQAVITDNTARLAGVRLNSFNAMPALFLTVNRAVPCPSYQGKQQEQGPWSLQQAKPRHAVKKTPNG